MIIGEYFSLPTTDSLYRFIYRLRYNTTCTAWQMDYLTQFQFGSASNSANSLEDSLKNFLLDKYRKMVLDSFPKSNLTDVPEFTLDLLKDNVIKLIECDIAPKSDPDGYMKEII